MAFIKNLFYKFTGLFIKKSPFVKVPQNGWKEEWTAGLTALIQDKFEILKSAKDITTIRPDFHSLSKENQVKVLVEFIKAVCYFESGYNPRSSSVDVGIKGNRDTYSVGLLQMSVVDQANYGLRFGYSYDDLLKPIPNLTLGVAVLAKQVSKRGKIILKRGEPGLYWAVICEGGKYDKSASIIKRVQDLKFESQVIPKPSGDKLEKNDDFPVSETPWLDIARKEMGVKEVRGGENKRIIEYHAATTLKATEDEVPWCSAFVSWCLEQAKYKSTKSAWARSYLNYGKTLLTPKVGCIVIFSRGKDSGHVGFYIGEDADNYKILSGNQSDSVCIASYPKSRVLGLKWPTK